MAVIHEHQILNEIEAHLKTFGPKNWQIVRDKFPEISDATFWRKVKVAKGKDSRAAVEKDEALFSPDTTRSAPSSEQLFDHFRFARQAARVHELMSDAEELKRQCIDKNGKIKNFVQFSKSIKIREQLLKTQLDLLKGYHDSQSMQDFYTAISDVICEQDADAIPKILEKLQELNEARGRAFDN